MKTFENNDEVMQYYLQNQEKNKVVIFEGKVIHVGEYLNQHPGGAQLIEDLLGKDIQ